MFSNLSEHLNKIVSNLRGQGRLTEDNIKSTLREVRMALLEADVALPVVKQFIDDIREKAMGQEVIKSISPGQALIKIVKDELVHIMGEACNELNLATQPPAVILMAGLQGSGKTTTVAKLARWLKEVKKKSALVVSADIYRPAAIEQLATLAQALDVECYPSHTQQKPTDIAANAIAHAKKHAIDTVIIDTAGRLHIDADMMAEIKAIHATANPIETLFVVDSMTGQDAANTAKAFNDALPLTGTILTKTDGDARGGAALSIRSITNKPIKFMGSGEKTDALEPFHPERIASRILGMGDVLTLVEEAERKVDKSKAEKLAKKIKKGKGFDLADFQQQLQQMQNMGGMGSLLSKLPGAGQLPNAAGKQLDDKNFKQMDAIINSMTPQERRFPIIIKGSRRKRIAKGSGTQVQDINRMLKQFMQMQKMMKRMRKPGQMQKMLSGLQGQMPGKFK